MSCKVFSVGDVACIVLKRPEAFEVAVTQPTAPGVRRVTIDPEGRITVDGQLVPPRNQEKTTNQDPANLL